VYPPPPKTISGTSYLHHRAQSTTTPALVTRQWSQLYALSHKLHAAPMASERQIEEAKSVAISAEIPSERAGNLNLRSKKRKCEGREHGGDINVT
jgi:hypothetical protein